jgi:hypothetical protein
VSLVTTAGPSAAAPPPTATWPPRRLTAVPLSDLNLTRPLHTVWPPGTRPQGPAHQLLRIARGIR